jgi:hypothetical protein
MTVRACRRSAAMIGSVPRSPGARTVPVVAEAGEVDGDQGGDTALATTSDGDGDRAAAVQPLRR